MGTVRQDGPHFFKVQIRKMFFGRRATPRRQSRPPVRNSRTTSNRMMAPIAE
jgi:hypothetical protein